MTDKSLLTASHVRYLMALKRLHCTEGIRGCVLAQELELTRPSVHKMMNTFLFLEYIEKEPGGQVFLTEYGRQRADFFASQYQKIKDRLFPKQEKDDTIDRAIYAMIAELSDRTVEC